MVATRPHLNTLSQRTAFSRVLSALLLVFVIYGTTIAAAHRHGRILVSDDSTTHSVCDDQNAGTLGGGSPSCAECLICQLQKHFFASLITVRDDSLPTLTNTESCRSVSSIFLTRFNTSTSGRAPPVAS